MSVIADIRIPACDFELGRLLDLSDGASIELETLVPVGERAVPFFWVYGVDTEAFAARLNDRRGIKQIEIVEAFDSQALYGLDWNADSDRLLSAIRDQCGQIVRATGSDEEWRFELRFPDHDAMSTFRRRCEDAGATITVARVSHPTGPDARARFGLTEHQHEALTLAVEMGYYEVPRRCTTVEVASELGISDQALTERLRRGISALAENTVFAQTNATAAE